MLKNVICSNTVDYSKITGERILPFVFTLDLEESVLYPEEGEYQKFCYDIEGVGQDTSQYVDLSHFLLGICSNITESDFVEISLIKDGIDQELIWGQNVEIKTVEQPDNPTGCVGLKFDFPLDKETGTMQVCFSFLEPYAIGPVNVCLFGGNITATGLDICGPVCRSNAPCESTFYQTETVCVPVTVTPYANPGEATASCCGAPVIRPGGMCAADRSSCAFTVTQRLCIEIPIEFGADVETGTAAVQCGEASETECSCNGTDTLFVRR